MDGKHFPKKEYQIGVTVPPFHPRCRGTTIPYFLDMEGYGERAARDLDGNTFYVPSDTTYEQWKQVQDNKYGAGSVDKTRKMEYNKSADLKQYEQYKNILKENAPIDFSEFTRIKYHDTSTWENLKYQFRTVNRYEIDGDISIDKIVQLDNVAYYTKKERF